MKKNRKQHLLLAVLLVVVIGVVCGGIRMVQSRKAAESEPAFSLTISGGPERSEKRHYGGHSLDRDICGRTDGV